MNTGSRGPFKVGGLQMPGGVLFCKAVDISSAVITGTAAGQFGHANGVVLVAAPPTGWVLDFVSALLIYDRATASYGGGGNITVNIGGGGAALTGLISAANSLGSAGDVIVRFVPLSTAAVALSASTPINLVSSGAFTQPGTAAGVVRMKVTYRLYRTNL